MKIDYLINALEALQGFPKGATARAAMGDELFEILNDVKDRQGDSAQAKIIFQRMMELDKWPGPDTFFTLARKIVHPPPEQQVYSPPWKGEKNPLCGKCDSLGFIIRADGVTERCVCQNGVEYPQNLLDLANARTATAKKERGEPSAPQRITQDDIDRVMNLRNLKNSVTESEPKDERKPN